MKKVKHQSRKKIKPKTTMNNTILILQTYKDFVLLFLDPTFLFESVPQ